MTGNDHAAEAQLRATLDAATLAEYDAFCRDLQASDPTARVSLAEWLRVRPHDLLVRRIVELGIPDGPGDWSDATLISRVTPETRARMTFDGKSLP